MAIQGLSDAYQELRQTGTNGIMEPLARLQAAGGKKITIGEDWHKTLNEVADDLKILEDKGQHQLADNLGRQILKDQSLTNLAKGGSGAIRAAEDESKNHGVITQEQAEAAQKAQAAWVGLSQSVTSFGNTLVTDLEPDITLILGKMDAWVDANEGWVASDIKADIEAFGQTLKDHKDDIKRFGDELMVVVGVAGKIAVAFAAQGPAAQALELFAVLIGTKILGPLNLARAALGMGLINPATLGAGAVVALLASGDSNKAMLDGGVPDANPRQNDLGLPGLDSDKDLPENKSPSDPSGPKNAASGFWSWMKTTAKSLGFGDKLQGDSRVKDDLSDIAKSTAQTASILKAQQDSATVSNASPVTVSSGGVGGSGQHDGGGVSPGATLRDRAGPSRAAKGALAANQKEAYAAALKEGLSPTAARALVANMSGEGLAVPKDYHWDGSHMASGIVQWDPTRSAAIKNKFGAMPHQLSVADQTRAAISGKCEPTLPMRRRGPRFRAVILPP